MAIRPAHLWGVLPDEMKQAVLTDLTTVLCEVIDDYYHAGPTPASPSQSRDLHSPVDAASGAHQHREPATATRHAGPCSPARLARRADRGRGRGLGTVRAEYRRAGRV